MKLRPSKCSVTDLRIIVLIESDEIEFNLTLKCNFIGIVRFKSTLIWLQGAKKKKKKEKEMNEHLVYYQAEARKHCQLTIGLK